jgi:hypothetical protein
MTDSDSGSIRVKLQDIYTRHAGGDLPQRPFRRVLTEYTYRLYRAVAREQLKAGESILHEHHIMQAHMWWSQSFLKDPNQELISLFLTDRRLIRIRSMMVPGRPISCDEGDDTTVDSLYFDRMQGLRVHRQIRKGEITVGLILAGVASVLYEWLEVTGPVLMVVGILGVLHGLLWPTRWVEVQSRTESPGQGPMLIFASRRKSGRRLVRMLRERLAAASAHT